MRKSNASIFDYRVHHNSGVGMCAHCWVVVVLASYAPLSAAVDGGSPRVAVLPAGIGTGPDQGVPRRFDEVSPLEPHARIVRPGEPLALRMEYKGPQEDVPTTSGGRTVQVAGDLHDQRARVQPDSFLKTRTRGGLFPSVDRVVNPGTAANARDDTRELSHSDVRHQFDSYRAGIVSGNGSEPGDSGYGRTLSTGHGSPNAEDQKVPRPSSAGAGAPDSSGHGAEIGLPQLAGGGEGPRNGIEVSPYWICTREFSKNFVLGHMWRYH